MVRNRAPYWIVADRRKTQLVGEFPSGVSPVEGGVWRHAVAPAFPWPTKPRSGLTTRGPVTAALLLSRKSSRIASRAGSRDTDLGAVDDTFEQDDTGASSSDQTFSPECAAARVCLICIFLHLPLFFVWALT